MSSTPQPEAVAPDGSDLAEAARLVRAVVDAYPADNWTARDRRIAHRLTGAAAALDALTSANVADQPETDAP